MSWRERVSCVEENCCLLISTKQQVVWSIFYCIRVMFFFLTNDKTVFVSFEHFAKKKSFRVSFPALFIGCLKEHKSIYSETAKCLVSVLWHTCFTWNNNMWRRCNRFSLSITSKEIFRKRDETATKINKLLWFGVHTKS